MSTSAFANKRMCFLFFIILIHLDINSQVLNTRKNSTLYGNWNFRYLLVNNNDKIWKIEADTTNVDYMIISFSKNDNSFNVNGTLIMKSGTFSNDTNSLFFNTTDSIDIIPKDSLTDYRRNIDWSRKFFEGKCIYYFDNDSVMRLYKTKDSILVFKKFE
jgi:hypothetical protein